MTSAIVDVTRVVGGYQLGLLTEDLDAIEPVGLLDLLHDHLVLAAELVHLDNGIQSPVGDKQVLLVDDEREGVSDEPRLDSLYIVTIQVSVLQ